MYMILFERQITELEVRFKLLMDIRRAELECLQNDLLPNGAQICL